MLIGCGNGAEERVKLAELEKQAEQKVAKAEREGKEKFEQSQKELETAKTELADLKGKLEKAGNAEGASDEAAKQAEQALTKARQAYKTLAKYELAEINKDIKEISTKSAKAKPAVKTAISKLMEKVPEQQKALAKDIAEYDSATVSNLDLTKAKVDKDLAAMRTTVRIAHAKLP